MTEQAEVTAFLTQLAGGAPIETHISRVFRGADTVWKLKKSVRLPFLDFSDLSERRRFLEREIALNAWATPGLYRDVVPVCRSGTGLRIGGDGAVLDWVLRMARVPEADFLDRIAAQGGIDGAMQTALGDAVAAWHGGLPGLPIRDATGRMLGVLRGNAGSARAAGLPEAAIAAWEAQCGAGIEALRSVLDRRAARGSVRRAHGDLHLGNLLMWQGHPVPFDALEFDEELATIDLGYDLAFLLMDLQLRVSRAAACGVLVRYVARTRDAGLVAALPVFLSLRAMIRAHVRARSGDDPAPYLAASLDFLTPASPRLVAVGGLMGTGKSTLARALAPSIGTAPGALVIRSDDTRKRLHGVPPEQRLPPRAYDGAANRRVDAEMLAMAADALAGGHSVILDATFLSPAFRDQAAALGPPLHGLWLEAPLAELEQRVAARVNDASDADVAVLRAAAGAAPPANWRRIPASDRAAALLQAHGALSLPDPC